MPTTIKLKNSVTTTNAPSSLVQGEVAINITDKKVWVGNAATTPIQLLGDGGSVQFTTVDTTNLQVTNIKAKDGTASASIANSTGAFTVAAAFAANGGATLGDASGDALTINSSAVSIPNGLNFDSDTLVIDATNNRVGVGTASPVRALSVYNASSAFSSFQTSVSGTASTDGFLVGADGSNAYVYNYENNPVIFGTNNTERMRIDSSGNVGIGVTPSYRLQVSGTAAGAAIWVNANNTDSTAGSTAGYFASNGTVNSVMYANGNAGNGVFGMTTNHSALFITNNTERMRITSAGKVMVGTTSYNYGYSGYDLLLGASSSPMLKLQGTTSAWDIYNNGSTSFRFAYNSSDKASINESTGVYTALSDINKKKDFEESTLGLDAVLQLKPTLFRMLDDADDAPKQLGFIAQEVKKVIPQAYVEQEGINGAFIGLQDRPIIAALTKAIQEQQAMIEELTNRIKKLEGV